MSPALLLPRQSTGGSVRLAGEVATGASSIAAETSPPSTAAVITIVVFSLFIVIAVASGIIWYLRRRRAQQPPAQSRPNFARKSRPLYSIQDPDAAPLRPELLHPEMDTSYESERSRIGIFRPAGQERSRSASSPMISVPGSAPTSERRREQSNTYRLVPLGALSPTVPGLRGPRWTGEIDEGYGRSRSSSRSNLFTDDKADLQDDVEDSVVAPLPQSAPSSSAPPWSLPRGKRRTGSAANGTYQPLGTEAREGDPARLQGLTRGDLRRVASLRGSGLFPS